MTQLGTPYVDAVQTLCSALEDESVNWALTGSTSFALQGVPVDPDDIDVQASEEGAYAIEERFSESVVESVSFRESEQIRSHFGKFELEGVPVEIMGAVQKRREDGTWESPVDVTEHREMVSVDGLKVPVLSLRYEARAYDRLGRTERAAILREHY